MIDELKKKFGLSYHIDMLFQADKDISLDGKVVLEIGGALPRDLVLGHVGAKKWLGVEKQDFYAEINERRSDTAIIKNISEFDELEYAVIDDYIEYIDGGFTETFDAIVSFAAFEHITRLPAALSNMYRLLKPGGKLTAAFSPIWSAFDGHHLHHVTDKAGNTFTFANSPIPPWGHLLMRPPLLYYHLLQYTDPDASAEIVYNVYNSTLINRLFPEDYLNYFKMSKFDVEDFSLYGPSEMPIETLSLLRIAYPGRAFFEYNGIKVILSKPLQS